ncbi:ester cyclase [Falsiroseomonas sp.]|uniref:ester cyclase n=1 Tax=Falsiroseomonas sp. TaxID=2870721 RepID=UPI0035627BBC
MGGCGALDEPCETPEPDDPGPDEQANCRVVRRFVDGVWNYSWSAEDDKRFLAERAAGNRAHVPQPIGAVLMNLRSDTTVRHRRSSSGKRVRSSGPDDYAICIGSVHEVAPDLRIEILDLVPEGERVVAHLVVTGTDRRLDGRDDQPGAFGAARPTGRRFRYDAAMLYLVREGRIQADWLLRRAKVSFEPAPSAA